MIDQEAAGEAAGRAAALLGAFRHSAAPITPAPQITTLLTAYTEDRCDQCRNIKADFQW